MEKQSFILSGNAYGIQFFGEKESHSWTETKSTDRDGEYDVSEWKFKWKGTLELLLKATNKLFEINFETFTIEKDYSGRFKDQSLQGMVLNSIKKTNKDFDSSLLADFIGENILNLINRRKSEKDEGLLGVTAVFKENLFDEDVLVSKGILIDSTGQMNIALA